MLRFTKRILNPIRKSTTLLNQNLSWHLLHKFDVVFRELTDKAVIQKMTDTLESHTSGKFELLLYDKTGMITLRVGPSS